MLRSNIDRGTEKTKTNPINDFRIRLILFCEIFNLEYSFRMERSEPNLINVDKKNISAKVKLSFPANSTLMSSGVSAAIAIFSRASIPLKKIIRMLLVITLRRCFFASDFLKMLLASRQSTVKNALQ